MKPRLLDLFCGDGGAAMGYHRAGFDVVGVDINPQPRYPFEFIQADAMTFDLSGYDAIHASPPCQAFTAMKTMYNAKPHADLLTPTRARLVASGLPYVMENVPGAPMTDYVTLCGTMFGLGTGDAELRRHRLFELGGFYMLTPPCQHYTRHLVIGIYGGHGRDRRRTVTVVGDGNGGDYRKHPKTVGVYGGAGGASVRDGTQQFSTDQRREAMGIDWMNGDALSQAIPPAYTEFIGRQLLAALRVIGALEERKRRYQQDKTPAGDTQAARDNAAKETRSSR
jgi:DNA (cytosine-5)-methyltransferase 1